MSSTYYYRHLASELASRYPTSAGPYYWSFQLAKSSKTTISFISAWIWLIGNWIIAISVNFGFASLLSAAISTYHPNWTANSWQLLLIFYAVLLGSLIICTFANRYLPQVDTLCATWTALTILIILIALSVKADVGRHSTSYALSHYDTSLSGWKGFSSFIGLLPPAYTFSALGMVSSMAEECPSPATKLPRAMSLAVPVGFTAGLFFIIPICITLPHLEDLLTAPGGQVLPYLFHKVTGSQAGGIGLTFLVLVIPLFCSISITVAASRATWAVARYDAIPLSKIWSTVHPTIGVPVNSLLALLGLINLGSTSAFTGFVSVGIIALAAAYAIPIALSLFSRRVEIKRAKWNCGELVGPVVNVLALAWIAFELVLFSMPTALLVTPISMNWASVIFVGFMGIAAVWYVFYVRKNYKGPPGSDALDPE